MTGFERRTDSRFNVDPIICRTKPESLGFCVLRNVSVNGVFLLNQSPPPVGSQIRLEISESPLRGYKIDGKVVRHAADGTGGFALQFAMPRPRLLRAVYHPNAAN